MVALCGRLLRDEASEIAAVPWRADPGRELRGAAAAVSNCVMPTSRCAIVYSRLRPSKVTCFADAGRDDMENQSRSCGTATIRAGRPRA